MVFNFYGAGKDVVVSESAKVCSVYTEWKIDNALLKRMLHFLIQ